MKSITSAGGCERLFPFRGRPRIHRPAHRARARKQTSCRTGAAEIRSGVGNRMMVSISGAARRLRLMQGFTVALSFTRRERARTVPTASSARLGCQANFWIRTRRTSSSISLQVAIRSSLMAFSSARVGTPYFLANTRPEIQTFVSSTTITRVSEPCDEIGLLPELL